MNWSPPSPHTVPSYLAPLLAGVEAVVRLSASDLERAALLIANGEPQDAWTILRAKVESKSKELAYWQLAHETLLLLEEAATLEQLTQHYAETFGELPPFALKTPEIERQRERRQAIRWPAQLTGQNVTPFVRSWPASEALLFDLSDLRVLSPEAAQVIAQALEERIRAGSRIRWRGLDQAIALFHPAATFDAPPEMVALVLLWLNAMGLRDKVEALSLEYAVRFDRTPPEWSLQAENVSADASPAPPTTSTKEASDEGLLLPPQCSDTHTPVILRRLTQAIDSAQLPVTLLAHRLRAWPFVTLATLAHQIRHQIAPLIRNRPSALLLFHRAPFWLTLVTPLAGLAPFVQFADNSAFTR